MEVKITAFVHLIIHMAPLPASAKSVMWSPSLPFHISIIYQRLLNEAEFYLITFFSFFHHCK